MSIRQNKSAAEAAAFPKARLSQHEQEIAELLEISNTPGHWRPDALTLERELLDRLVDGTLLTKEDEDEIDVWTEWAPEVQDAMPWWNDLAWAALKGLHERNGNATDIERRLAELVALETAAFSALSKARIDQFKDIVPDADTAGFDGRDSTESSRELARRYRTYTRYVDALVIEAFPDLSRELLLNPWPEWAYRTA